MRTPREAQAEMRAMVALAVQRSLRPPVKMRLPEWADTNRRLSMSSGAVGGAWRTSRHEVARGPMMSTTEPGVQIITVMVATQLLKTELLLNVIGRQAHLDPCPMLMVLPKDEAVDAFSKERLAPMITATPVLREVMGDRRTRRTDDTLRFKAFPGGFLAIASAGSPTNLAMRAIRITLLDEVDKYEVTKEGDPIKLAEERSSTFRNRLSIRSCSPTWEETSRIYRSYQESDQRRAYVTCPHCGESQTLEFFRHVQWPKKGGIHYSQQAQVFCEHCGAGWSEQQRIQALHTIRWHQTRTFVCCGEGQDPRQTRSWEWDTENQVGWATCVHCGSRTVSNQHAGFTASKLYSPLLTMGELAAAWLEAKKDIESTQTFYNTQLALPYRVEATKEADPTTLMARRETWEQVPDEVLVITVGVDIHPSTTGGQEGRIELEAVGWGLGEESWSLDYQVFTGDPAQSKVWDELDEYLLTPMTRQDGRPMSIRAVCVDSGGHNTQEAYNFARQRTGRNVWAIKGSSDREQWSPIWPALQKNKRYRAGYRPIIIGVSAAKEAVRQRLLIKEPGPGFCHFPTGRPSAYFDQLTSERLVVERRGGAMVRRWTISNHKSNEALDTRVYAYTALWGLYHVRRLRLDRLHHAIHEVPPPPAPARVPPAAVVQRQQQSIRTSSWITRAH